MRMLVLFFATAIFSFGNGDTFHIVTAAKAYDSGKKALQDKQTGKAIRLFREAIEIEPTFTDAFKGLAGAYLASGHRIEAAAVITQMLEFEPDATRERVLLGRILLEEKQPQRAVAQFSLVLKTDPFNSDALLGFASGAKQIGLADRAAEAMKRGRTRYPSDPRFSVKLPQ